MDIGIIGGGPMGLSLGYYALRKGHDITIYEKDEVLGGMSASFNFDGDIIEKYYHFFCKTDYALFELLKELDIHHLLRWHNTKMGFYYKKKLQDFGDPISLLRLDGTDLISKIRYALFSLYSIKKKSWNDLDEKYAIYWIKSFIGEKAYNIFWDKLMSLKFYEYQNEISAAWIWQRIKRVGLSRDNIFKESLGYVEGGVKVIIDTLEKTIKQMKGKIIHKGVKKILVDDSTLVLEDENKVKHDAIVSTIPINLLYHLIDKENIANKYKDFTYLDVMCVVIKLKKPLSKHFWININDDEIKIPGLIHYTTLRKDLKSNIVYIPFYLPKDGDIFKLSKEEIKSMCKSYTMKINPKIKDKDFLAFDINIYKNAQSVYKPRHLYHLPSIRVYKNLYALDTSYYYPEDRGFSESVKIAKYVVDRYL